MAHGALPLVDALRPEERFTVAAILQVNSKNDRWSPRLFGALDDGPADFPDIGWIKLLPYRPATSGYGIFNRGGGHSRKQHEVPFGTCRSGHSQFAIRMECLLGAHRREHDGRVPFDAKNGPRHVDVRDIHQSTRPNLNARITLVISADGGVVVHAGGEISPMSGGNVFSSRWFKIHHVERLVGRGNY